MPRIWKTPYTHEAAVAAGVRDFEGSLVTGNDEARWIYCVEVLDFKFSFFSLDMLREYIDFFSRDLLPRRRGGTSPFSCGPAASQGDGQSMFERLPARLRARGKRERVAKVLSKALTQFQEDEPAV